MQSAFQTCALLLLLGSLGSINLPARDVEQADEWPMITKECRPWTYWWWLGSAVNRRELTRHLEAYRKEGMGGVHIVPIYGAKGYEDRYIRYLTPQWMEMLAHTVNEAARLDMGVDMTSGTGWPFGGPWVGPEDAAARVFFEIYSVTDGIWPKSTHCKKQPEAILQTLMAFSSSGDVLDLTEEVDANGKLSWKAPSGQWKLYAVFQGWTEQHVKRAAPGAEGNVLDYFSKVKLHHYLSRFDEAFQIYNGNPVRAFYNDSFEVYHANWTDHLFKEFRARRGYDLRRQLPALLGEGPPDRVARVRSDFRETISDLLLEEFTLPWADWCHSKGSLTRNQAHGSPGNLIDLYGAADIPETEGFGPKGIEILVGKLASSAAHLLNKPRTSSETCTWLGEHFQVSLARAKQAVDPFFLSGINHIFYHGMPFSPEDAPYPGWLFYASTHFGLTNTFHRDFPQLNHYIARCQSFLQAGTPANDILLYFPIYDLWPKEHGSKDLLQYCTAHNSKDWLKTNLNPTYEAAATMWDRGYSFDYVSDRILNQNLSASSDGITNGASFYRAVVIAGCERMPPKTLASLMRLATGGGTVIFVGDLPQEVPGLGNLADRRARLKTLRERIQLKATGPTGIRQANIGEGRILVGDHLEPLLASAAVPREALTDFGIQFIRRKHKDWVDYFLVNRNNQPFDDWLPICEKAKSVVLFDPLHEVQGIAKTRHPEGDGTEVRLQLDVGESRILRAVSHTTIGEMWQYKIPGTPMDCLTRPWKVEFLEGGPSTPRSWTTNTLCSWTENGDPAARDFSGTTRYQTTFTRPSSPARGWLLDLGRVCQSARVILNGERLGTVWCEPFHLDLRQDLRAGENTLQIEVTNLMANRMAAMDRAKTPWQIYFFVNIRYRKFDASSWSPFPSGLLGPVRLIPYGLEE